MLFLCFIWFTTFESDEIFYPRRLWKNAVTDDDDCCLPQGCHGNDEELEDNSLRIFENFKHDKGRDDIKWHICTSKRLDSIDMVYAFCNKCCMSRTHFTSLLILCGFFFHLSLLVVKRIEVDFWFNYDIKNILSSVII